jgi:branched-subunit amino acid transport protein
MKRKIYITPIIITSLIFLILRFPYRTLIYEQSIFDYYIADTAPNFLAALLLIFIKRISSKYEDGLLFIALAALAGLIAYEVLIQPYLSPQMYDVKDIIASIIGTIIGFLIAMKLENLTFAKALNMNVDFEK